MRRPTVLYRIMTSHLSRISYLSPHADHSSNTQTPGHRLLCPGVFHSALAVLRWRCLNRWRFHGHHCASIYQAFPDPERTILWPPLRHTSAQQSAIISPSSIQAVPWLLHGLIMGRYKANKEPDNDHRMLLAIERPTKCLYLAIIGPDKDLLLSLIALWCLSGSKLVTIDHLLVFHWPLSGHHCASHRCLNAAKYAAMLHHSPGCSYAFTQSSTGAKGTARAS